MRFLSALTHSVLGMHSPEAQPISIADVGDALGIYNARFRDTPGFFMDEAIAMWDFLLLQQAGSGIQGNFLEIGVFGGKSAYLGAVHTRQDEACLLVDIGDITPVAERIRKELNRTTLVVTARSDDPAAARQLAAYLGTVRWFHIDGDHSGFSTANDLRLADRFLAAGGIICVDDFFNPRYPQLSAAVYKFLFDHSFSYRMVLCGMNKCYLVRTVDYGFYEDLIRKYLCGHLSSLSHSVLLSKSSWVHDMGCFAVLSRSVDVDLLGRDEDPEDIPF
jgi:hypothetical protein